MLKNISITNDTLRAEFMASDDNDTFESFDPENWSNFDWALQAISTTLGDWLRENPVNAALAGDREGGPGGMPYAPMEGIDLCLIASVEGTIEGYTWTYDLWGARSLSLSTQFREYKYMRSDAHGIDGCIEVAQYILALVNDAINNANAFYAGGAA